MAPTWTSRALLRGSLFSFSSSGAACLSANCFNSAKVGMRRPGIEAAEADGGIAPAVCGGGGACDCAGEPGDCAGSEGACDPWSRYPMARPTTRQRTAIP